MKRTRTTFAERTTTAEATCPQTCKRWTTPDADRPAAGSYCAWVRFCAAAAQSAARTRSGVWASTRSTATC